MHFTEVLVIP